eukprot:907975-Pelagomonas_calceolata.AAC.1
MYALSFVHIEVCMLQGEPRAAFLSFVRHGAATVRAMRCPCIKFCARSVPCAFSTLNDAQELPSTPHGVVQLLKQA